MKEVDIVSKIVNREGGAFVPSSKGTQSIDLSDYLLKSIWDKVFEVRTDSQGIEYIFGKLPVVTQYGITMYAGDGVDVPSLASGLPFDGRTIWYNPDTQQIEVIGGTGGGSGEGVSNFWDLSGIPSWITISKPKYTYSEIEGTPDLTKYALVSQIPSLSGYATESWVNQQNYAIKATTLSGYGITDAYTKTNVDDLLKSYVTLGGTQTITGEKNFVGGLKVNGSPIYYDTEKKYWKLEGDLLVTGGVTMYSSDSSFTPSTIMDAILYDSATLGINSNGQLYVKGGTSGGGLDITALQNYLTSNSYLNVTSGDNRYLKLNGGEISSTSTSPLTINTSKQTIELQLKSNSSIKSYIGWNVTDGVFFQEGEGLAYIGIQPNKNPYFHKDKIRYTLWHEGNFTPSNYLSLNGGTIQSSTWNPLIINTTSNALGFYLHINSTSKAGLVYNIENGAALYNSTKASYIGIKDDGTPHYNGNTLIHSGNIGSQSVASATYASNSSRLYSTDNIYSYGSANPYYGYLTYNQTYNEWDFKVYPKTPDYVHVYSCDKLRTARTIWGHSFDGTGSIDGDIYVCRLSGSTNDDSRIIRLNGVFDATTNFVQGPSIRSLGAIGYGMKRFAIFQHYGNDYTSENEVFSILPNGNVGIGTTSPSYKLDINGSCYASTSVISNMHLTNGEFGLWKGSSFTGALSANDIVYYAEKHSFYGSVGIGATNMGSAKLRIKTTREDKLTWSLGSLASSCDMAIEYSPNASEAYGLYTAINYHTGDVAMQVGRSDNNTSSYNLLLNPLGGKVGIGTSSTQYLLDINTSLSTTYDIHYYNSNKKCSMYIGSSGFWYGNANTGNGLLVRIQGGTVTDGSGGIVALDLTGNGNLKVAGGITMYSDQRKKTILNHVELSLKQIADAPLIEHYYNSDESKTTHVGSIAQYWANMNDWFCKLDSEGYYTMEIQNAALASAISIARELDRYETKTDKAIKKLKKRICELEEEIERLKAS